MSHPIHPSAKPVIKSLLMLTAAGLVVSCSSTKYQSQLAANPNPPAGVVTPFPEFLNDSGERINRGVFMVNEGLLVGVIHPTAKVYRTVVPTRARQSIQDFSRNITYPGRVVNHMLQGRWEGAGDETTRFLTNSTVGLAGFFDPATKWGMPKSDANFGQTFGTWGWTPENYVMLPFFGPSDERSALGLVGDKLAEPLNYYPPYDMISPATTYNRLTDLSEDAKRMLTVDSDPYVTSKIFWSYANKDGVPDLTMRGPIDKPTLQTFAAVKYGPKDKNFQTQRSELTVKIPSTGRKMKSSLWLQPGPAPLVYIAPGLTSHRLSNMSLGLAELLYQNGYSVVSTTSVFHTEFMNTTSSAALPAYPAVDSQDLWMGISETDRMLSKKYPGYFTKRAMVGTSMGGYMTLRIAANEKQAGSDHITFDRYVAINMPVDLTYGFKQLDGYVNAPLKWPAAERQQRINNTLHKVSYAFFNRNAPTQQVVFDGDESKYLVGLAFRIALRDIIFDSQSRENLGVLQTPISSWRREPVYNEILGYSFNDYFERFAIPYYQKKGISADQLERDVNLKSQESKLRAQSKIRVITNQNDFLLRANDIAWLRSTFPASRLTLFPEGGHLGNIGDPAVQNTILKSLQDIK